MEYASVDEIIRDLEANPIERSGHIYHTIPFPEFAQLTVSANADAARKKLQLITDVLTRRRQLGLPCERLLDVGANAGLFTFSLAEQVASVTAYEPHPRYGPIGEYLAHHRAPNVDWRARPFSIGEVRETWDVALMLSSFQWITDGDHRIAEGRALLRDLSRRVSCLIFELGLNSGKSKITTRRLNHVGVVYRLLATSTEYNHVKLVARSKSWHGGGRFQGWRFTFVCSQDDAKFPETWYAPVKHLRI